jgi:hypothetical protein
MRQIQIPARFNGPPNSGNGGYSCGLVASHIDGAAKVRLHSPPPLDTNFAVRENSDGTVELFDGEALVASGATAELDMEVPRAPTLEQARRGTKGFICYEDHVYETCFVCGPGRPHKDGLALFPGPVDDWSLLACPWEPAADLLDESGNVRPEIVWAALDCPGCFGAIGQEMVPVLLGELVADLRAPVPGDETLVVFAWPIGRDGRKIYGGAAVADQSGEVLACSRSTWIALKPS